MFMFYLLSFISRSSCFDLVIIVSEMQLFLSDNSQVVRKITILYIYIIGSVKYLYCSLHCKAAFIWSKIL